MNEEQNPVDFTEKGCNLYAKNCEVNFDFNEKFALDIPPILKTIHTLNFEKGFKVEIVYQKALELLQNEGFIVQVKNLKWKLNSLFKDTDLDFYELTKTLNDKSFYTYYVEEDGKEISVLTKFVQIIKEKFK